MELLLARCMGTFVSVMSHGNTMRRILQEHRLGFILPGRLVLLRMRRVYGHGNKWIIYTLAASPVKYLFKLKILQCFAKISTYLEV